MISVRPTPPSAAQTILIKPAGGWRLLSFKDLWVRRELLYFFVLRDLKARYAQTVIGAAWTILQPLALMLVFTLAFRRLGKIETDDVPYPLFVFSGLVFWTFFSRSVSRGSSSLVANAQLLTKAYFPRLIVPLSSVAGGLFDLGITLGFLFLFDLGYGEIPTWRLVFLPLVLSVGLFFAVGLVLLFSAMNVRYRDVTQALPLVVQLWLFLSPVAYPLTELGEPWTSVLAVNPLVGIIEGFRWSVIATSPPDTVTAALGGAVSVLVLLAGLVYFNRVERSFADVV